MSSYKQVVVVGAGVAGLCSAMLLEREGYDVVIVEASDKIGGRIRMQEIPGYDPVEIGGEFMHEITIYDEIFPDHNWKINTLITWAQGDGPAVAIPNQLTLYWMENQKRLINSCSFADVILDEEGEVKEQIESRPDDELVQQIKQSMRFLEDAEEIDYTTVPPELNVVEYLTEKLQIRHPDVLDLFNAGFSNTYCSNSQDLRMREVIYYTSLYEEDHDAEHRLELGFSRTLIPHLTNGRNIIKNWEVKKIEYNDTGAKVTNSRGETITCDRVIVTPTHQLINELEFTPKLPKQLSETIASITLDNAIKVILIFEKRFWPKELHGIICAGCVIPEIWFIERSPNDFAVVGFTTSTIADNLQKMGKERAFKEMADQLNRMFGQGKTPASQYVASAYHDWSTDPFVRGGYMCVLPKAKRDVLFSFDHPTLYFAGESYGSAFSSVGAALESGVRVVNNFKKHSPKAKL